MKPISVNAPEVAATTHSVAFHSRRSTSLLAKPGIERVISSGRCKRSCSKSTPRRFITPGRKLSMTTSACSIKDSASASPLSDFRLSLRQLLLRLSTALAGWSHCGPSGGSICTTVAPRSANVMATAGPAICWPKSTMRTSVKGKRLLFFILLTLLKNFSGTSAAKFRSEQDPPPAIKNDSEASLFLQLF